MKPELVMLLRVLDAALTAGINVQAAVDKIQAMRQQGPATLAQLDALAAEFESNLRKL
jgi:hypothetical protein